MVDGEDCVHCGWERSLTRRLGRHNEWNQLRRGQMSITSNVIGIVLLLLSCGGCICTGNMWGHAVAKGLTPGRNCNCWRHRGSQFIADATIGTVITYEDDYSGPLEIRYWQAQAFSRLPLDATELLLAFGCPGLEVNQHSWWGSYRRSSRELCAMSASARMTSKKATLQPTRGTLFQLRQRESQ